MGKLGQGKRGEAKEDRQMRTERASEVYTRGSHRKASLTEKFVLEKGNCVLEFVSEALGP